MTDNLVAAGKLTRPIPAKPATTRSVARAGGYPSTVTTFDLHGCRTLERWVIHGMDHFWPGGSSDPTFAPFTDPKGPDGSRIAWQFFKRFRLQPASRVRSGACLSVRRGHDVTSAPG